MDTTILEFHNELVRWAANHSGSDYILILTSLHLLDLDVKSKHKVSMAAVAELELHNRGPVGRHTGVLTDGEVRYTIGGVKGGTEIRFTSFGCEVISYYYHHHTDYRVERLEKGRVKIVPKHTNSLVCEWSFNSDAGGHSWGRLNDLVQHLEQMYLVSHSGDDPRRVVDYVYDRQVGGGF